MLISNMAEYCSCCNGCSSRRQLSFNNNLHSSPKKLLVAISIVVVLTMCMMPSEARHIEHRRRHDRNHRAVSRTTKDILRHHNSRPANLMLPTKDSSKKPKNPKAELVLKELKKIMRKVRNTKSYYDDDWKLLQPELHEFQYVSMPSWVPSVNFVDIHFHDYRRGRARSNESTIPERRYAFQMPKLYKSLLDFQAIFNRLQAFHLNFPDDPYNTYKRKRQEILNRTLKYLYSTIHEVSDSMIAMNLNVSLADKKQIDLSELALDVDLTQCFKNDYLAFRAYGNMLNHWYLEFKCRNKKLANKGLCRNYVAKLEKKRNSRKKSDGAHKKRKDA